MPDRKDDHFLAILPEIEVRNMHQPPIPHPKVTINSTTTKVPIFRLNMMRMKMPKVKKKKGLKVKQRLV